jgi:ketosteroid isomerase-like protein
MLSGTGVSWEHGIQALEVRGDRAIQYGTSELRYCSGKDTLAYLVRYTLIWHRDDAGIWWMHRDHYTSIARAVMEE